jgi:NAD(P)-dependent dehydrogenase (short-subunit alcohol dehydrogenase family)
VKELEGKRAVITGAGSGLGRALSLALMREGCRVGIADIDQAGAAETLGLVEKAGGRGEACPVDVTDPDSVKDMADRFEREWGGVDLLVNNAGIAVAGLVGDMPLEDWRRIVAVNLMGVVHGCHEFIPRMSKQGGGHIVNVASFAGIGNLAEMAGYNVTKAAVISLSETLKMELAPQRIGVTVVCPLFFNTGLIDDLHSTDPFQEEFARACFRCSRTSAEEVAAKVVEAVRRNRFYLIPQRSGKVFWALKRVSPPAFACVTARLNRAGVGRPLLMWAARRGLL